jgi:tetrahydromethanopterin S-methyltransferase subunit G
MEHDTIALKGQLHETFEMAVARINEEDRKQVDRLATVVEKASASFAAETRTTVEALNDAKKDLAERYERVIEKLESANLDEAVRLSRKIIKSINIKFGILLVGTAASIVLAILAYIK